MQFRKIVGIGHLAGKQRKKRMRRERFPFLDTDVVESNKKPNS